MSLQRCLLLLALVLLMTTPAWSDESPPKPDPQTEQLKVDESLDAARLEGEARARLRESRMTRNRQDRRAKAAEAVPSAQQLYLLRPDAVSLELLTQIQLMAKQYPEARETAETWARWRPEDFLAQFLLGQALIMTDGYESALPPLQRAIDVAADDKESRSAGKSLGFALEKLERYPEAIAAYESAGDDASVLRAQENQSLRTRSVLLPEDAEDGTICLDWRELEKEAERLEAEMEALDDGG